MEGKTDFKNYNLFPFMIRDNTITAKNNMQKRGWQCDMKCRIGNENDTEASCLSGCLPLGATREETLATTPSYIPSHLPSLEADAGKPYAPPMKGTTVPWSLSSVAQREGQRSTVICSDGKTYCSYFSRRGGITLCKGC
jgi:hypothetical protein